VARRTERVTIEAEGRDQGKTFVITEMDAAAADDWAMRALFTLANSGVPVIEAVRQAGMAGLAQLGPEIFAYAKYDDMRPLMDTLWDCVAFEKDPAQPLIRGKLKNTQIEESGTFLWLKLAAFQLHTGFSWAGAPLPMGVNTVAPPA